MINLNKFAKEITLEEGKLKSVSIAQVKEIIKITLRRLSFLEINEVERILHKYK